MNPHSTPYAVIGAGPAGLAAARNPDKLSIPFVGFEMGKTVGGLWIIDNSRSTMYQSAHRARAHPGFEGKIGFFYSAIPMPYRSLLRNHQGMSMGTRCRYAA